MTADAKSLITCLVVFWICIAVTLTGLAICTDYDAGDSVSQIFGYPIVSVKEKALGLVAIGGQAYGVITVGGFALGVVGFGFIAVGLFGMSEFGVGLLLFCGQVGIGAVFAFVQWGLGIRVVAASEGDAGIGYKRMDRSSLREFVQELLEVFSRPLSRKGPFTAETTARD